MPAALSHGARVSRTTRRARAIGTFLAKRPRAMNDARRSSLPSSRTVAAVVALLCAASTARADQAADAFNAWSAAFFVQSNGQTFYSANPITEAPVNHPAGWIDGLVLELVDDVYQRNHTAAHRQLIDDLTTTYLANDGSNWCGATPSNWMDGWNDDLGWMMTGVLHAYQITGNTEFLTVATNTWNCAYDRGWDTQYGGGGVWELMNDVAPTFNNPAKCALSNDPLIIQGLTLYQITGDATYLTKSEGIYAWVRGHLFDAMTGEVHGCWGFTAADDTAGHLLEQDDNAYNDGTFLEAAEGLYRLTGDDAYYQDALLTVTHRVTEDPILHSNDEGQQSEWAYPFVKGLSQFATYNGLWHVYRTWMENNANAAWSERSSLNVTWNDWTTLTPDPAFVEDAAADDITSLDTRSAAGIWQFLPQALDPTLVGYFELRNVRSNLSLTQSVADDGGSPPIAQEPFAGSEPFLWTFVPTDGGYYRILNADSGLALSVESNSAQPGAAIVALPISTPAPGNDQWLPVVNGDGTYTFYNLSSILALDDPGASQAAGTQFGQWFGNGTPGQEFQLIAHGTTLAEDAGDGEAPGEGGSAGDGGTLNDASLAGGILDSGSVARSDDAGDVASGERSSSSPGACGCRAAGVASQTRTSIGLTILSLAALRLARRRKRSRSGPAVEAFSPLRPGPKAQNWRLRRQAPTRARSGCSPPSLDQRRDR
jgi:glycosyl hydrolase family 76/ricin-type beta-trefoil lectin protein